LLCGVEAIVFVGNAPIVSFLFGIYALAKVKTMAFHLANAKLPLSAVPHEIKLYFTSKRYKMNRSIAPIIIIIL